MESLFGPNPSLPCGNQLSSPVDCSELAHQYVDANYRSCVEKLRLLLEPKGAQGGKNSAPGSPNIRSLKQPYQSSLLDPLSASAALYLLGEEKAVSPNCGPRHGSSLSRHNSVPPDSPSRSLPQFMMAADHLQTSLTLPVRQTQREQCKTTVDTLPSIVPVHTTQRELLHYIERQDALIERLEREKDTLGSQWRTLEERMAEIISENEDLRNQLMTTLAHVVSDDGKMSRSMERESLKEQQDNEESSKLLETIKCLRENLKRREEAYEDLKGESIRDSDELREAVRKAEADAKDSALEISKLSRQLDQERSEKEKAIEEVSAERRRALEDVQALTDKLEAVSRMNDQLEDDLRTLRAAKNESLDFVRQELASEKSAREKAELRLDALEADAARREKQLLQELEQVTVKFSAVMYDDALGRNSDSSREGSSSHSGRKPAGVTASTMKRMEERHQQEIRTLKESLERKHMASMRDVEELLSKQGFLMEKYKTECRQLTEQMDAASVRHREELSAVQREKTILMERVRELESIFEAHQMASMHGEMEKMSRKVNESVEREMELQKQLATLSEELDSLRASHPSD
ncbi:unnamed protein product [Cyprideis torosa]|uniref:Uncharacterized protein n=1 Tax=Cyprideis torosa TaxID=163714 RepID=A0A7R8W2R2_9CRUS|nr:unnamed protein product [Cyprideis torosa]CAG0882123.1 unnamed protein product [Cyprideis torosa]